MDVEMLTAFFMWCTIINVVPYLALEAVAEVLGGLQLCWFTRS